MFVNLRMQPTGCNVERIRSDRILHEALTAGADPLHLTLVFGISHNTAVRYATVAEHLLSDELEHPPAEPEEVGPLDFPEPTANSAAIPCNSMGSR
jgi:hypothetical protein